MGAAGNTIIAGIGQTDFSKNSGRSELQLAAEAGIAAIRDAGMTPADIDGLVTFTLDSNDELLLARCLGIPVLRYWSRTPHGGAGAHTTVQHASLAVHGGAAKAVLVYRAFNERSGRRFGQPNQRVTPPGWNWYLPFGLDSPAKTYSLAFQRYMYRFGLTNEAGAPVWHELHATDYDGALAFYRDAFGWTTTVMSDTANLRMSTFSAGGDPLAGIFDASGYLGAGQTARWMPYFGVEDADAAASVVVSLGGTQLDPVTDSPFGRLTHLADPTGALLTIIQVM